MKKTGRCLRRTERREELILRRRRERKEFRPFAKQPTQNRLFRIREMHLFIDNDNHDSIIKKNRRKNGFRIGCVVVVVGGWELVIRGGKGEGGGGASMRWIEWLGHSRSTPA